MEKATFYLPCPSRNGDEYPPSFEGYYDPSHRWNGWVGNPLFTREIYDKIVEYYTNEEFNTEEDIEYIKEFTDPETNKTSLNVSMHGSQQIPTPHIDRLAREGLRMTDMHSPSAVCTPTRYGAFLLRFVVCPTILQRSSE